ncbi:MAG: DUF3300 domain-containing protein [Propionivibrio sp.]|nr:DUF3300 domain-containing protein [Propionivibrio sp.]
MKSTPSRTCTLLTALMLALNPAFAQQAPAANSATTNPAAKTFSQQDLDQLVAPIALYPDPLLAQIFMASTYPLEVVEAARWSKANPKVSGQALETAMASQPWDPAVKSLTSVPQVLQQMNENLSWTQKLGDAFLAQQDDLMNTVQALRAKAAAAGNLKTTEQQVVKTETQGSQTIYVVESPKPDVIYVPTYNPSVVYGAWWYPTPPYYMYPPSYVYPPGLAFATGVLVGAAIWGNCNWGWGGRNNVNVNVNRYNSFNRTNISNNNWNHNVNHRGGVAYKDKNVARQYNRGGNAQATQARENFRGRAEAGRSDLKGMDRNELNNRVQQADRGAQASTRDRAGNAGTRESASTRDRSATAGTRDQTAGSRDRSGSGGFSGVGNGASTREASQRGSSSRADFTSSGASSRQSSGGGNRGGGGGGGGGRGGGGGGGRR